MIALLLTQLALADPPPLTVSSQDGVHVLAPEGWKVMIDAEHRTATASAGLVDQVHLYWFGFKDRLTLDRILDILLSTTNENLRVGAAVEEARGWALDGSARTMSAHLRLLWYDLPVRLLALNDAAHDRLIANVLISGPDSFDDATAFDLLARMTAGFHTDRDDALVHLALNPPERQLYADPPGSLLP